MDRPSKLRHYPSDGQLRQHELVWFSHLEKEYEVLDFGIKKFFQWRDDQPEWMWDWDNCSVSRAKILTGGKVRIVIRSKTNRNSDFMGHIPIQLRYMLGIDIQSISEPWTEPYDLQSSKRKNLPPSVRVASIHDRWVCKLGERYWIWQWAREGVDIKSTKIYMLYQDILSFIDESRDRQVHSLDGNKNAGNIFRVQLNESLDDLMPVIYQPAIDSLKNFVREIHCAKLVGLDSSVNAEISLVFNNEDLRRHRFLDWIYAKIRLAIYGRTMDVETFKIHLVNDGSAVSNYDNPFSEGNAKTDNNMTSSNQREDNYENKKNYENYDHFIFEGIYSGEYNIEHDTIHLDQPPAPKRSIEYYFINHNHPIVFINTANHAMSEHDNNHDIWKWEYIPWIKKAPMKLGVKTRRDIDSKFISIINRVLKAIWT